MIPVQRNSFMVRFFFYVIIFSLMISPIISEEPPKIGYILNEMVATLAQKNKLENYTVFIQTGIKIDSKGSIRLENNFLKNYRILKKQNKPIYPMVAFLSVSAGKEILSSESIRKQTIQNLLHWIQKNNIEGIHLDLEYLPPDYSNLLGAFLKEFYSEKPEGVTISMALFPPLFFKKEWSDFHSPKNINKYLDFIVLMSYDYHNAKTEPGPVTSIDYSKKNIEALLKYFPAKKIWLGIPLYGYYYTDGKGGKVISMKGGAKLKETNDYRRDVSGCVVIQKEKVKYYFPDITTINRMSLLAQEKKIAGIAFWRAGFE